MHSLDEPPVRIERTILTVAREYDLPMCGFTGASRDAIHCPAVYDEVLDGRSVSTRRPSTHE